MQPDHPAWVLGGGRDLRDRQGRSVRSQDGVRAADPVKLGENLPLDLQAFGHDLDRQVDGSSFAIACSGPDPRADLGLFTLGEFAPAHCPGQGCVQDSQAAVHGVGVGLDRNHADPRPGEHLSDAGPHGAQPDDGYLAYLHGGDITAGADIAREPASAPPSRRS